MLRMLTHGTCACQHGRMMKRTNYFYPIQMLTDLRKHSVRLGISMAEIIRRAVTEWLERNK